MNKSRHLKVKGMHCTGCEETTEKLASVVMVIAMGLMMADRG